MAERCRYAGAKTKTSVECLCDPAQKTTICNPAAARCLTQGPAPDCKAYYVGRIIEDEGRDAWECMRGAPTESLREYVAQMETSSAPNAAVAVTKAGTAADPAAGTLTISPDADSSSAPPSPAGDGHAAQNPSDARSESLADDLSGIPDFDRSGLSDDIQSDLDLAEHEYISGRKMAEIGIRRMADGVAIAHDALCVTGATNCRTGQGKFSSVEKSFSAWCAYMGINKKAAERLLQVSRLFDESSPRQQAILEELSPSLLYAAAKPSAPAEAVAAVKSGGITTHKEYQDLLAKLKSAEQSRNQAVCERDSARNLLQNTKSRLEKTQDDLTAANSEIAALKKRPIEVAVEKPDPAEIDRLAGEKAEALTASLREQLDTVNEKCDALRRLADNAADPNEDYDALLLALRAISNMWQSVAIPFQRLPLKMRKGIKEQVDEAMQGILDDARLYCEANPREETA